MRQKSAFRLLICSVVLGRSVLYEGSVQSDGLVELATKKLLNCFCSFEEYIHQNAVSGTKSVGAQTALHLLTRQRQSAGGGKKERRIANPYLLSHRLYHLTAKACHS
jgi:hypothetical protein